MVEIIRKPGLKALFDEAGIKEVDDVVRKRRINKEGSAKSELGKMASKLFLPAGKNPYFRGGRAIKNFSELVRSLSEFTENEAQWVASWIDYLGDKKTAMEIGQTPARFREIITTRFNELKHYAT